MKALPLEISVDGHEDVFWTLSFLGVVVDNVQPRGVGIETLALVIAIPLPVLPATAPATASS